LAFAAFVAAMTVGRFTADWVSAHVGPEAVIRYGCAAAAVGMAIVLLSGVLPLTLFGWVVFGLGLSGAIPQVFSAAGNLGSATQFSRVVGGGYVAFLAGPAVIGWLADVVTLRLAMAVPLLAVVVCTVGARAVRPPVRSDAANVRSEAADPCT
jgi:MFS family permease